MLDTSLSTLQGFPISSFTSCQHQDIQERFREKNCLGEVKQMKETTRNKEEEEKEKVCKRCKVSFNPCSNTSSSCSFHPSFFVCRRHDDQKRYYELGPDDPPYAAKFYDCCGAENPEAPGCTVGSHISYDDE